MKRTFFSTMKIMSLLLVAAGVLMTSCKDQVEEDEVGKTAISISATIENFEANRGSFVFEGELKYLHKRQELETNTATNTLKILEIVSVDWH